MRHDAKLGLALGMLVIGFAVAFCFPRQPERVAWQKSEIPAPIIDASLDFLPIRAYQTRPIHAGNADPGAASTNEATAENMLAGSSSSVPVATPVTIGGVPIDSSRIAQTSAAPTPITPIVLPSVQPLANVSAGEAQSGKTVPAAVTKKTPAPPSPEPYLVKPGDTLSGIAARCLGSSVRYQELFEANRDVLSSPNDLKIGMQLRIPTSNEKPDLDKQPLPVEIATQTKDAEPKPWAGLPQHGPERLHPLNGNILQPPPAPWVADRPQERN